MLGIQRGLNSISRAVRVMEKALHSSYTLRSCRNTSYRSPREKHDERVIDCFRIQDQCNASVLALSTNRFAW